MWNYEITDSHRPTIWQQYKMEILGNLVANPDPQLCQMPINQLVDFAEKIADAAVAGDKERNNG